MPNTTLVLATIDAFGRKHPTRLLGRTKLQKLCYFAGELRVPYDLRYEMYFYGPYSAQLEEIVRDFQVGGLVHDSSEDPERQSKYKITDTGKKCLVGETARVKKWMPILEAVAKKLGVLKPEKLELLATVKFTFDRQKSLSPKKSSMRKDVVKEVLQLKGDKFDKGDVEGAYDSLDSAGLLKDNAR